MSQRSYFISLEMSPTLYAHSTQIVSIVCTEGVLSGHKAFYLFYINFEIG